MIRMELMAISKTQKDICRVEVAYASPTSWPLAVMWLLSILFFFLLCMADGKL